MKIAKGSTLFKSVCTALYHIFGILLCVVAFTQAGCSQKPPQKSTASKHAKKLPKSPALQIGALKATPNNSSFLSLAAKDKRPWVSAGKGFGTLNLGIIADVKVKIKPGIYTSISYDNAKNVIIDATNVKLPGGSVDIAYSNNVEIFGFSVTNQPYRAVNIRGLNKKLYLHDLHFENIENSVITFEYDGIYDGTQNTVNNDSKIANCTFTNVSSAINLGGGLDEKGNIKGLVTGFKVLSNTFKNCPDIGNVVNAQMVEDIEVAYNLVDSVNTKYSAQAPNGTHNGIFAITGNGSVHDNKVTNHQGNLVRFWGMSIGPVHKKALIFNNYVFNSWKYSAIEIQVPPYFNDIIEAQAGKLTFADFEVYNNTAGQLNNSLDWEGQMLDLYNTHGAIKYYNNLGFKMNKAFNMGNQTITKYQGITNMVNFNGNGTSFQEHNNHYFKTQTEAEAFKKANPGIGSPIEN